MATKEWRTANRDWIREYQRRYRLANPEKLRKKFRTYRERHPDRKRAAVQKWRKANPDKRHARRVRNAGGSWTAAEWRILKHQFGNRCVGCGKSETELRLLGRKLVPDHIVPISKDGLNDITNLQPLCHGTDGCNNRKGAKFQDFVIS